MLTKINVFIHVVSLTITYYTRPVLGNPGSSSCHYLGALPELCSMKEVPVSSLPDTCTSIFYDGIMVDPNNKVSLRNDFDQKYLGNLEDQTKPIYILYSHSGMKEWETELNDDKKRKTEAASLKTFTETSPVAGILLSNLDANMIDIPTDYSANLGALIDDIKNSIPTFEIGLSIPASFIQDQKPWLDIKSLNDKIQFYVIDFRDFNNCTAAYHTGTAPLDGDGHTIKHVMEKLTTYGIGDFSKVILRLSAQPIGPDNKMFNCDVSYSLFCDNASVGAQWYLDSDTSYHDKGKFVKDNNFQGFLMTFVDFNDNQMACQCGSFPSYQFVYNGYNGMDVHCDKFNGPIKS